MFSRGMDTYQQPAGRFKYALHIIPPTVCLLWRYATSLRLSCCIFCRHDGYISARCKALLCRKRDRQCVFLRYPSRRWSCTYKMPPVALAPPQPSDGAKHHRDKCKRHAPQADNRVSLLLSTRRNCPQNDCCLSFRDPLLTTYRC